MTIVRKKIARIVNRTFFVQQDVPKFIYRRKGLRTFEILLPNNNRRAHRVEYRKSEDRALFRNLPVACVSLGSDDETLHATGFASTHANVAKTTTD